MWHRKIAEWANASRPVWGAWIEILAGYSIMGIPKSRAPYGARGLKSLCFCMSLFRLLSRPVWGAWIEITPEPAHMPASLRSRPVWGAWIEMDHLLAVQNLGKSRAPYGARGLKFRRPAAVDVS